MSLFFLHCHQRESFFTHIFKFTEFFLLEVHYSHFVALFFFLFSFLGCFHEICYEYFYFQLISALWVLLKVLERGLFYNSPPFCIKARRHCILRLDFFCSAVLVATGMQCHLKQSSAVIWTALVGVQKFHLGSVYGLTVSVALLCSCSFLLVFIRLVDTS